MNPILIVGAGIGGLCTALALQRRGIEVRVFEAACEVRAAGAGIIIAPNGFRVLAALGLSNDLQTIGVELERLMLTDAAGRFLMRVPDQQAFVREFGHGLIGVLRPALYDLLLRQLEPDTVQTAKALTHFVPQAEGVLANFADGSQVVGRTLIGADGIHSVVRKQLFPALQPRYSGQTSYRGVAPYAPANHQILARESWGMHSRFGLVTVDANQMYWYATEPAMAGQRDASKLAAKRRLLEYANQYAPPLREVIEATPETHLIRTDMYDLPPLPRWYVGRVVLIGDAAHATTPNLGQGGNQALEDALVLANALAQTTDIEAAFTAFTALRKPRAEYVVARSRQLGNMVHLEHGWQRALRDALLRCIPASVNLRQNRQIYG